MLLTLPGAALLLGAAWASLQARVEWGEHRPNPRTSVAVQLQVVELSPLPKAADHPGWTEDPVQGEGFRDGTGTLDPVFLNFEVPDSRARPVPWPQLSGLVPELPDEAAARPLYRADLPLAKGGNGLPTGAGRDLGTGRGKPRSTGPAPADADEVRIIRRQQAFYPSHFKEHPEPVLVKVAIDAKGKVLRAEVLAGPAYLHACCLRAAKKYRFHIPERLKASAPLFHGIRFIPVLDPEPSPVS